MLSMEGLYCLVSTLAELADIISRKADIVYEKYIIRNANSHVTWKMYRARQS